MKTLVVSIKSPADGDLVILEYSSARGGVTSAKHKIKGDHKLPKEQTDGTWILEDAPGDTPRGIATKLAESIQKDWMPEAFEARVNDAGDLIIGCTGLVQNVKFKSVVEGNGGTTVEITEF